MGIFYTPPAPGAFRPPVRAPSGMTIHPETETAMPAHPKFEADLIRAIHDRTRTIAVVGLSPRRERPSHGVAAFLQRAGFRIVPVNPGHAGERILGEVVAPDLLHLPDPGAVDMVDIFRRSEDVAPVVAAALEHLPNLRTIWMQIGIRDEAAAAQARGRGVDVIQDRCPAIEWAGLASRR